MKKEDKLRQMQLDKEKREASLELNGTSLADIILAPSANNTSANIMNSHTSEDLPVYEEIKLMHPDALTPYPDESIRLPLYIGQQRDNLISSIKNSGILIPIIASKRENTIVILSGHNRVSAAKELNIMVPVSIRYGLTEDEERLIVIDTNLMHRDKSEMLHSQKAALLCERNEICKRRGYRNDIFDPNEKGNTTARKLGSKFSLSKNTVFRYIRLSYLHKELLKMVDKDKISFQTGVELSYLKFQEQTDLAEYLLHNKCGIKFKEALKLREVSKQQTENINIEDEIIKINALQNAPLNINMIINNYVKKEDHENAFAIMIEGIRLYYEQKNRTLTSQETEMLEKSVS